MEYINIGKLWNTHIEDTIRYTSAQSKLRSPEYARRSEERLPVIGAVTNLSW